MMWLKACPRCKQGDMYMDEDDCKRCWQCGYVQGSTTSRAISPAVARWFGIDDGRTGPVEQVQAVAV